jgi:hypothetical protein
MCWERTNCPLQRFEVDQKRVNATGQRIARGLFFIETGNPLPASANIHMGSRGGLAPDDPVMHNLAKIYRGWSDQRYRDLGSAFSYGVAFHQSQSVWLFLLYEYFAWIASIDTDPDASK